MSAGLQWPGQHGGGACRVKSDCDGFHSSNVASKS